VNLENSDERAKDIIRLRLSSVEYLRAYNIVTRTFKSELQATTSRKSLIDNCTVKHEYLTVIINARAHSVAHFQTFKPANFTGVISEQVEQPMTTAGHSSTATVHSDSQFCVSDQPFRIHSRSDLVLRGFKTHTHTYMLLGFISPDHFFHVITGKPTSLKSSLIAVFRAHSTCSCGHNACKAANE